MAKQKSRKTMDIVDLANKVGFTDSTCPCGECKSDFQLTEVGAVRATLNGERPTFDLLCRKCIAREPFADVTVFVTDTVNEIEVKSLLADMYPGEINMWVRVVSH